MTEQLPRENYLGIDWGSKGIGIALAHAETRIAVPLAAERNDMDLIEHIGQLIARENIATVVIGIPEYVNREEAKHPAKAFGQQLSEKFGVAVAYQNEMFSTKLAQQTLIQRGERHVGKHDDAEAAGIILQQWLDRKF